MKVKNPHLTQMVLIIVVIMALIYSSQRGASENNARDVSKVSYSEFIGYVDQGALSRVTIDEDAHMAYAITNGGEKIQTAISQSTDSLNKQIVEKNINLSIKPKEKPSMMMTLFTIFAPVLLLVFLFYLMSKKNNPGNSGGMTNVGKSKAKLSNPDDNPIRFSDVAGCDEAKEEVSEIVDFLKNPDKFLSVGAKIPKGVIMSGPPGTGKTLLAKAIAGEAGVPFFTLSGSDFVEMFVGVGASRVRDLFEQAKKVAPCIIFIDEIDAIGKRRGSGINGNGEEREQTLNSLLVHMDGFDASTNIIMIGATNRKDVLDPALVRPGRFDREVAVGLPDVKGREKILEVHAEKVKMNSNVSLSRIARGTSGFSGAELANLVNEAALIAARAGSNEITQSDFEKAKEKLIMGYERVSHIMPQKQKVATAWHEAGHAVIAYFLPDADPLHKVSIVPRGNALGVTMQLPLEDRYGYEREELLTEIAVLYGGRIAEQMFLGKMSTGASNDIERATSIAKSMVVRFGMSKLGPLHFGSKQGTGFRGDQGGGENDMSARTHDQIDEEVKSILTEQYDRAVKILTERKHEMGLLTQALLDKEVLDKEEIDVLFGFKEPVIQKITHTESIEHLNEEVPESENIFILPTWGNVDTIVSPSMNAKNDQV